MDDEEFGHVEINNNNCSFCKMVVKIKLNTNISLIRYYDNGVYTSTVTTEDSIQRFSCDIIL